MIIEMEKGASEQAIQSVINRINDLGVGFEAKINCGTDRTVIAVLGSDTGSVDTQIFAVLPGVEQVIRMQKPYKLASKDFQEQPTIIRIGDIEIGGKELVIMAGPCSVEPDENVTLSCARIAKEKGAKFLRGGAFKPRTSPFAFQGLGEKGLKILEKAKKETGLLIVTEVVSPEDIDLIAHYADVLQIGARNMQNYRLLEAVGKSHKPVLLKRGLSATVEEWLQAADYILRNNGEPNVILCHRGIRTFDNSTRFTYDVGVIPLLRKLTHLPIISDPSHPAGKFDLVPSYAKMAVAGGTDGLIIEIHPDPKNASSDGAQSLTFNDFSRMMDELKILAKVLGKKI